MIDFTCAGCGKQFKVADEHAGRKCRCPRCKTTGLVPFPDQADSVNRLTIPRRSRFAARAHVPPEDERTKKDNTKMVAGLIVFFIFACAMIFSYLTIERGCSSFSSFVDKTTANHALRIEVIGSSTIEFNGDITLTGADFSASSRSVSGRTPATYTVHCQSCSVSLIKQSGAGRLTVEIYEGEKLLQTASTSAEYGVVALNVFP